MAHEPKPKKTFSRRHSTSSAHEAHRARWRQRQADKRSGIEARATARARRSPADQLAMLDARLGAGVGAVRERARLLRQLEVAEPTVQAVKDGTSPVSIPELAKSAVSKALDQERRDRRKRRRK